MQWSLVVNQSEFIVGLVFFLWTETSRNSCYYFFVVVCYKQIIKQTQVYSSNPNTVRLFSLAFKKAHLLYNLVVFWILRQLAVIVENGWFIVFKVGSDVWDTAASCKVILFELSPAIIVFVVPHILHLLVVLNVCLKQLFLW